MTFPVDFVSHVVSRVPASPGDLELDALFEDQGVCWLPIDEMFALEWATYWRCFPTQPLLSIAEEQQAEMCSPLT